MRNPCLHRGCHPQGLMNPAEVVIHEVKSKGAFQVVMLLGEGIRQSGQPPHAHPHGQILPFEVAC